MAGTYLEIMVPGFVVGAIIGFLTQRVGTPAQAEKGGEMKRLLLAPAISTLLALGCAAQSDQWAALRVFEGKWEGPTTGKPGKGSTSREFQFLMNGRFLSQRDKSVYRPEDPAAKQAVHEDFGFFSYDTGRKKVVWRQFHSEGLVNEYTLDSVSADGKSLEFRHHKYGKPPGISSEETVPDSLR